MEASTRRLSAAVWDLAIPAHRQPGLAMAGFRGRAPSQLALQLVPYPAVTVFIEFGDGTLIDAAGVHRTGGGVVGLAPGTVTAVGRKVDCLQIRLSPVFARAVFGDCDPTGVLPLDAVWGRAAQRLCDRLHAASSWDERFAIATMELARRRESGPAVDPEVAAAWHAMVHSHGQIRIERIADEIGWGRKRLWSRFGTQIGLPPKRAAQLIRFDDAAHRLATGAAPAEVAGACGYADQSHLHRDARLFAGLTPAGVAEAPWLDVDPVAWQ
ncbi:MULTISPECIES: helix-turn-helix domain-containing protein [unclassified Mycobacterium]|uniref:helix-turn-helix domain-containing protein n=1 Tax=unclassified Mycobacterium TaxID=2642494 RepID=UPI00037B06F0|nr:MULTISPECIES: helix-turn-helix domain-containing protein [unclassified Mycobacterium]SEB07307.1 Helix-turn-helix domain-containing protein [Mycobacterium sp. 283mftsu]